MLDKQMEIRKSSGQLRTEPLKLPRADASKLRDLTGP